MWRIGLNNLSHFNYLQASCSTDLNYNSTYFISTKIDATVVRIRIDRLQSYYYGIGLIMYSTYVNNIPQKVHKYIRGKKNARQLVLNKWMANYNRPNITEYEIYSENMQWFWPKQPLKTIKIPKLTFSITLYAIASLFAGGNSALFFRHYT